MWKSLVATTCAYWEAFATYSLMAWATAAPPLTASEPPSQKSFWTSTTISARMGLTVSSGHWRRDESAGLLASHRPLPAAHPARRPVRLRSRPRRRLRRRPARLPPGPALRLRHRHRLRRAHDQRAPQPGGGIARAADLHRGGFPGSSHGRRQLRLRLRQHLAAPYDFDIALATMSRLLRPGG